MMRFCSVFPATTHTRVHALRAELVVAQPPNHAQPATSSNVGFQTVDHVRRGLASAWP